MIKRFTALIGLVIALTVALGSQANAGSVTTLSTLTFPSDSIVAGNNFTAAIKLTAAAPREGVKISLKSNSDSVIVPDSVTIKSGLKSANVSVKTTGVSESVKFSIVASDGTTDLKTSARLVPASISKLRLSNSSVAAGNSVTGTISLNGKAGPKGLEVSLKSDSDYVSVPDSVTVAAGKSSATFTVKTSTAVKPFDATITANDGVNGVSAALSLQVVVVKSITFSSASVTGGKSITATVTLSGPATKDGLTIKISNENQDVANAPESVQVESGAKTATFKITTAPVSESATVSITLSDGQAKVSGSFTVKPAAISSVSVPKSVFGNDTDTNATVTLTGPAPKGGLVAYIAFDSDNVKYENKLEIAGGETKLIFPVHFGSFKESTKVTLTVTVLKNEKSTTFTVAPVDISSVTAAKKTVTGGSKIVVTVKLNLAATEDMKFSVDTSDGDAAPVRGSVVVKAGATSATITITTGSVKESTEVKITVASDTTKKSGSFMVNPSS